MALVLGACPGPTGSSRQGTTRGGPPQPSIDPKLAELAPLPVGIEVTHSPSPVRAHEGGRSGRRYTWQYTTTVRSLEGVVRVEEFGSFAWHEGRWVFSTYTDEPFTAAEFANWYSCPEATLTPDEQFSDPTNWSGADVLRRGRCRWYFIGVTEDGRRVKGEAAIERLPEIGQ